jgi:F-type H+-transporting ATPase subunit gamma
MASLKQLKDKQTSVKSIHKITSAMELVATAKSRTATKQLAEYKTYYQKVEEIVATLTSSPDYVVKEEYKGTLYIVYSADFGMAGGYNSNVIKLLNEEFDAKKDKLIVVGNRAATSIKANHPDLEFKSYRSDELKKPMVLDEITIDILESHYDHDLKVDVIYTRYVSQIDFVATKKTLLPVEKPEEENNTLSQIEFEPSATVVLKEMMDTYIPSVLMGLYKESVASEHSSRRVAMENATSNGEELLGELQVQFNKQRQAKITQELSEISAGSEALK